MEFRLLAVGDVVGQPGLTCLSRRLRGLRKERRVDFCVVNGENANGVGLFPRQADLIFDAGADVITLPAQKGAVTVFDFDGSYIPTGIAAAATEGISLSVNGRTLTLAGNVAQVKVYDLQCRLVKSARGNVLTLGKACGQTVVVEAEAADGSKATFKAVLK